MLDAFAGGFVMQTMIVHWFHEKFGTLICMCMYVCDYVYVCVYACVCVCVCVRVCVCGL